MDNHPKTRHDADLMEGFLLIDKPAGMTSHDVVDRLRRFTGTKTIGHAGTLDPFATGLLLVGVGRTATREMQKLVGLDKEYQAVFVFGATSDTDDGTGKVSEGFEGLEGVEGFEARIRAALPHFTGDIEQVPPAYAAIKIGGKKMYEAAREGKPLKTGPRRVRVYTFDLLPIPSTLPALPTLPTFPFHIACSSGTYIRALARDLGAALGIGAYVQELRRTKIGPFSSTNAVPLNTLSFEPWKKFAIPVQNILSAVLSETPASAILKQ